VHVDRAERLTRPREDPGELLDVLGRFRWRLAREQLLLFGLRGLIASCAILTAVSVTAWLVGNSLLNPWTVAALLAGPAIGLLVALVRWPSTTQAARIADTQLGLDERLSTAVELVDRTTHGRFDGLQVRDAIATAQASTGRWRSPFDARGDARLGALALALALGSLLLPFVPRPTLPLPGLNPAAPDSVSLEGERVITPDVLESSLAESQPAEQAAAAEPNLAPRVEQALAEREALDRLAEALSQTSASQGAADAIERGDFSGAREQLSALGEEADQLSDAAKRRLSQALQSAANATTEDRQLADRERQAATALSRSNYAEQRQALRQLGEQLERSGARAMPQSQLARDSGRLQQQQQSSGAAQSQSAASRQNQAGAQAGAGQSQQEGGQQAGDQGVNGSGEQAGEQGGPGSGTGATEPVGGPNDTLGSVGERVEVPTKLGTGPGQQPPDGTEDQVGADPGVGVRSVAEATHAQQTGQVAPEQNLVPGEQRPVVRGYFR
jgi:hypothetical protein